jgi:ankyrin repeat protein
MDREGNTPFLLACYHCQETPEMLRTLLRARANPRAANRKGAGAFHMACRGGSRKNSALPTLKLLLSLHINPKLKDRTGSDACWTAAYQGDIKAYEYLKEKGCESLSISKHGESILFEAVRSNQLSMVRHICENEDINLLAKNHRGENVLLLAKTKSTKIWGYLSDFDVY